MVIAISKVPDPGKIKEFAVSIWNNRKREEILKIFPENSVGAEIGVYRGDFSRKILRVAKPAKLHLIDPWWLLGKKRWSFSIMGQSVIGGYIKVIKRFEDELVNKKVEVDVGFSQDVLKKFPDNYFDWVYLDSSHLYKQTLDELELLKAKVKDNGIISGHDWQPDPQKNHHGLYKAVNKFLEKNPYEIIYLDQSTQWAIKRK